MTTKIKIPTDRGICPICANVVAIAHWHILRCLDLDDERLIAVEVREKEEVVR